MNIKGTSRAGGRELAKHLLNAETNETVKIFSVDGTVAQDLYGAFDEMEAVASGTRCQKPLYHAKISPDPKEPAMTPAQWTRAVEALRDQLGFEGHAYAAVLHRKYGAAHPDILREHMHVVFCRINPDTMRAMHDGHNYRQHEFVARQLETEFGHARIQGAHIDRDGVERPQRTPPDWAMQQAAKSGIQPRDVAATVKALWQEHGTGPAFVAALRSADLTLAMGRRDLVVLDQAGDVHTLARCLNVKVAEIRQRLADVDRSKVPTVEDARAEMDLRRKKEAEPEEEKPAPRSYGAEVLALAAMLEKPILRTPSAAPANDYEALREKIIAFGYDASKPETLGKWQELGSEVAAGRITEKDRFRDMAEYLWLEADKERRSDLKSKQPEKGLEK